MADGLYRRWSDKLAARKIFITIPLALVGACLVALRFADGVNQAVALLALALLVLTVGTQAVWASISEVVPMNRVGGTGGFVHFLANLSGVLSPAVTGFAVAAFGTYSAAFFVAAGIAFVASVAVLALLKRPQAAPVELKAKALMPG
jgi:sugar phosphate permease